jgi:hypothetical protein
MLEGLSIDYYYKVLYAAREELAKVEEKLKTEYRKKWAEQQASLNVQINLFCLYIDNSVTGEDK